MLVYMEESCTDHLNALIPVLANILLEDEEQAEIKIKVYDCLRLIGRFAPQSAFEPICKSVANLEITTNERNSVSGLVAFKCITAGYFEALPKDEGLLDKYNLVHSLLETFGTEEYLNKIDRSLLPPLSALFKVVFDVLLKQAKASEVAKAIEDHTSAVLRLSLSCISMPIYLIINDTAPEINYKQIKSSIKHTYSPIEVDWSSAMTQRGRLTWRY